MPSFQETCLAIGSVAERIDNLAQEVDPTASPAQEIATRLRNEPFRVLVIGEFSRGKSTFINAYIGEKVLPSSVRPTTAVISVIRSGSDRSAVVHWRDAARAPEHVDIPDRKPDKALKLLTAKNDKAMEISHVEVVVPIPGLSLPVEIVDTPGVNDIDTQREEITYGYLARADAAIMLLDLHQPISGSEKRFLTERVLSNDVRKLLFVVNKIDQESPDKLARALDYVRGRLEEVDIGTPQVCGVASKPALKAKTKRDGALLATSLFPAFEGRLNDFLLLASGQSRVRTACDRVARVAAGLRDTAGALMGGLQGEQQQIEAAIGEARQRQQQLAADDHAIQAEMELALASYVDRSRAQVVSRLATARAEVAGITGGAKFPCDEDVGALRSLLNRTLKDVVELPAAEASTAAHLVLARHGKSDGLLPVVSRGNAIVPAGVELEGAAASPQPMAMGVGSVVGAAVGGALLGPLGAIPLAVFGGWIAGKFSSRPDGGAIRTRVAQTLQDIESRTDAVLKQSAAELRTRLTAEVLEPRRQAIAREQQTQAALTRSLGQDTHTRAQAIEQARQQVERAQACIAELEQIGGVV